MPRSPLAFLALSALVVLSPACGSGGGGAGGAGGSQGTSAGDGHVHPPGNGVAESESTACDALTGAASSKALSLGCVSTIATCPDFLRMESTTSCLEYDQGSVQGCIAYYDMATTCDGLATSVAMCAVMPIADSAPKGCP